MALKLIFLFFAAYARLFLLQLISPASWNVGGATQRANASLFRQRG